MLKKQWNRDGPFHIVDRIVLYGHLKLLWKYKALYLMLLPGVAYYIIYRYVPMYGLIIAFKDFDITEGIVKSPWGIRGTSISNSFMIRRIS